MSRHIFSIAGKLKLLSAMSIGNGTSELSDKDVLLDSSGHPFIPSTSFLGKLYAEIPSKYPELWGRSTSNGKPQNQSRIKCSDLLLCDGVPVITSRESIRIDSKFGTCANKAKYNYQVVEPGVQFFFKIEISAKDSDESDQVKILLNQIITILKTGLQIGSKTSIGLGALALVDYKVSHYDLDSKDGMIAKLLNKPVVAAFKCDEKEYNSCFTIEADFHLCGSMIIRSYNSSGYGPDTAHITSGGKPIVTGSSLKGVLKARAEKILNTLNPNEPDAVHNYMAGLFGDIEKDSSGNPLVNAKSIPSRFKVSETVINDVLSEQQTRIKIDRFTGGTIDGALLEEVPIFQQSKDANTINIQVKISIVDAQPADKGIAVLLLKDLWTGDLPIGGERSVGRGYLKGIAARINEPGAEPIVFSRNETIAEESKLRLDDLIKHLATIRDHVYTNRLNLYNFNLKEGGTSV